MSIVDNRTLLNDCEDDTQTFGTTGAQLGTSTLVGTFVEGAASVSAQHSDVFEDTTTTGDSAGSTFSINMSDVTVYLLVKDGLQNNFAAGGVMIVIGDGTNRIGYFVGGNDAVGLAFSPFFNGFKLDVSVIVATPGSNNAFAGSEGSLDQTVVSEFGYGSLHLAKGQGAVANVFLDNFRYIANDSAALTIQGGTVGTPETMTDVVGDDIAIGASMVSNPLASQFQFFAPTEWGDTGAGNDSFFTATDEQWYLCGDNSGGHAIGVTHFPFSLIGNSTGTNSWVLTRTTIVNTGTRAELDLSDPDVDIMKLDACALIDIGAITMPTQIASDKFCNDTIFINCAQVFLSSLDMTHCTFDGTTDPLGAILWDGDVVEENQDNLTFNSDGTGHAIEISLNTASLTTYNITSYEVSGYETLNDTGTGNTVFLVDNALDGDVTINVVDGVGTFSFERAAGYTGTVTINQVVNVNVGGVTEGTSIVIIADDTVGSVTIGDTLLSVFADSLGETSFIHNFEGDLNVIVRTRNQGIAAAAIADDGGALTDETTEANSFTTDDMNILPASPLANDQYNFGSIEQFDKLKIDITDANGTGSVITWQYFNGTIFTDLSGVVDGTNNFENTGRNTVSWTLPGDWETTTINGQGPFFYVRARLTTLGSANQTRARKCTLDTTRYLMFSQSRTIDSTGLSVMATWIEDTIALF